ncbi:MAG: 50S ribosomal protein L11 methyltransferase [Candidatus Delongbacteria bacterium]|nr:50S ribosomal protein L11 methyltransferase [Candidatus Cloacimonadota bacterium]MCB9472974.1 50S ribosomal protein L11 methyltransferase [Candidatus Delongbacteria bacterium]
MHYRLIIQYNDWASEPLSNHLFEAGASGLEEDKDKLEAWFPGETDMDRVRAGLDAFLESLAELTPDTLLTWNHRLESREDEDWNTEWKKYWAAQPIGQRILICPTWLEPGPEHADRLLIRLDPGSAFGTGTHETTRLLLECLEELELAGRNVLDAGCGTGVLAIAALKLGAGFAWGIDIEDEAVRASRENAAQNGCRVSSHFQLGSPASLDRSFRFDILLANIQRSVIEEFFADFLRLLVPGGRLLVSGILSTEEEAIHALARQWHTPVDSVHRQGEWLAFTFTAPSDPETRPQ